MPGTPFVFEPVDAPLREALAGSQRFGMLGDRPIEEVVEHSDAFVQALHEVTGTVLDLGTGGGVPGLVIAWRRPDLSVILVDRRATRTDHVARMVHRLGLDDRVSVITGDAAALPQQLDPVDVVVARGYGPPGRVLRDARRLVRPGGLVVISEPPDAGASRWTDELLDGAGMVRVDQPDSRVVVLRRR